MKKFLTFSVVVFAAATLFASCKKDYTCTCTTHDSGGSIQDVSASTTIHETKSKATSACEKTTTSGTFTTTCVLK